MIKRHRLRLVTSLYKSTITTPGQSFDERCTPKKWGATVKYTHMILWEYKAERDWLFSRLDHAIATSRMTARGTAHVYSCIQWTIAAITLENLVTHDDRSINLINRNIRNTKKTSHAVAARNTYPECSSHDFRYSYFWVLRGKARGGDRYRNRYLGLLQQRMAWAECNALIRQFFCGVFFPSTHSWTSKNVTVMLCRLCGVPHGAHNRESLQATEDWKVFMRSSCGERGLRGK